MMALPQHHWPPESHGWPESSRHCLQLSLAGYWMAGVACCHLINNFSRDRQTTLTGCFDRGLEILSGELQQMKTSRSVNIYENSISHPIQRDENRPWERLVPALD